MHKAGLHFMFISERMLKRCFRAQTAPTDQLRSTAFDGELFQARHENWNDATWSRLQFVNKSRGCKTVISYETFYRWKPVGQKILSSPPAQNIL
jgi:hypothetical protein